MLFRSDYLDLSCAMLCDFSFVVELRMKLEVHELYTEVNVEGRFCVGIMYTKISLAFFVCWNCQVRLTVAGLFLHFFHFSNSNSNCKIELPSATDRGRIFLMFLAFFHFLHRNGTAQCDCWWDIFFKGGA